MNLSEEIHKSIILFAYWSSGVISHVQQLAVSVKFSTSHCCNIICTPYTICWRQLGL